MKRACIWTATVVALISAAAVSGQQPTPAAPTITGPVRQVVTEKFIVPPAPLLPAEDAWIVPLDVTPSAGGAMDDETVYVPLSTGQLVALDRETGLERWRHDITTPWPPSVGFGAVYVATADAVHAIDAKTGEPRWRTEVPRGAAARMDVAVWPVPKREERRSRSSKTPPPRLTGTSGLLVLAVNPDEVWALDTATGQPRFQISTDGASGAAGVRAGENGVAYASMADSRVIAVNLQDGTIRWSQTLRGDLSAPAVARERVFVGSTDRNLYALDDDNGRIEWIFPTGGDVIGADADEDNVYFASLDNVVRRNNRDDGNQRWRAFMTTRPVAPPIAFAGVAVVPGVSPTLSTFDGKTGAAGATYSAPSDLPGVPAELAGGPLVDRDMKAMRVSLVIITRAGRVVGLRPTGMLFRESAPAPLTIIPGRVLPRESFPTPRR